MRPLVWSGTYQLKNKSSLHLPSQISETLTDQGTTNPSAKMSAYDVLVSACSPRGSNNGFDPRLEDKLYATKEQKSTLRMNMEYKRALR